MPDKSDRLAETCRARELDPSFHVTYSTDERNSETENLTHASVIDEDEIEERGDTEVGWLAQLAGEQVELIVFEHEESGWALHYRISVRTAEQLSDMFARAAEAAKQRAIVNALLLEAEEARVAASKSKQGTLPLDEQRSN